MTDWIRDPDTNQVKLNSDQIHKVVKKLMDRVKSLAAEKDEYAKELKHLKEIFSTYTKNSESMKYDGFNNTEINEDDDLETDGCSPTKEIPVLNDSSKTELTNNVCIKKIDSNTYTKPHLKDSHSSLIDHSACCSKELSLKLIEQNQNLQKTIRDILKMSGHSIDDYLKFTYNREKLMAKDQEIKDLKAKVKGLKDQSYIMSSLGLTKLSLKEEQMNPTLPINLDDQMLGLSKDLSSKFVCKICKKGFKDKPQDFDSHQKKCREMIE